MCARGGAYLYTSGEHCDGKYISLVNHVAFVLDHLPDTFGHGRDKTKWTFVRLHCLDDVLLEIFDRVRGIVLQRVP